jgi:hypothetical protein
LKTLASRRYFINMDAGASWRNLIAKFARRQGWCGEDFALTFKGKLVVDLDARLEEHNVRDNDSIDIIPCDMVSARLRSRPLK